MFNRDHVAPWSVLPGKPTWCRLPLRPSGNRTAIISYYLSDNTKEIGLRQVGIAVGRENIAPVHGGRRTARSNGQQVQILFDSRTNPF